MATRRPRIKPVANIQQNSKRKTKPANDIQIIKNESLNFDRGVEKQVNVTQTDELLRNVENASQFIVEKSVDTAANGEELYNKKEHKDNEADSGADIEYKTESKEIERITIEKGGLIDNKKENISKNTYPEVAVILDDSDAFKCPPKVGFQRSISHTSNSGIDDVFYSDIEENAMQMDLDKSPSNSSMSPSKNSIRQRIRPTPHFSQRRNSFVGSSPPHTTANEENHFANSNVVNDFVQTVQTKRERHHSASLTGNSNSILHHHHTSHKYLPTGITNITIGRIRTESGCSAYSDKTRKTEEHKQNSRKDFQARFYNGVPEKSAFKMSDLIYYNPITNPIEQKPNLNVKMEQTESSSNDVKPFSEIHGKDTQTDAGVEAAPVPQLKLNAKGELILDDKSLVIETTAEQEARKMLANSSLIYLDENTGMNGFYSRQKRTREWGPSETIKFYRCLQNIGTDFSLMVSLFPNRTRRDLKLKFKKEERKNAHLINKALLYPKQFDIETLKSQMNEEEKQREEQTKRNKTTKESKKRKICTLSKSERVLINEDVYQNENEGKTKRVPKNKNKKEKLDNFSDKNKYQHENEQKQEIFSKISSKKEKSDVIVQNETISRPNDFPEASKSEKVAHNKKEQKVKKRKNKSFKKIYKGQVNAKKNSNNGNSDIQPMEKANVHKRRRRRKRTPPNKLQRELPFKAEIKVANKQACEETEYQDTKQLQTEINELLDSDLEIQHTTPYETSTQNAFSATSQDEQCNKPSNTSPGKDEHEGSYMEVDQAMRKYQFVNSDDRSSTAKDDIQPTANLPSPDTRSQPSPFETEMVESAIAEPDACSSVIPEREVLNEEDIQSILTELAEGSLALVSTLDPDDPDKVLNEIYMVDKNTGDLCEEPLNIPENIVQCILTVVS